MFKKKKKDIEKPKMNRNATSMQRRLKTPFVLTYLWFHTAFLFINFGLFFLVNFGLRIMMVLGGKSVYLGVISPVRIPNNYSPAVIRYIYYIDPLVVSRMLLPSLILLVTGIVMLIVRHFIYKTYVKAEVFKEKKKNAF
jgi:hypothetical protein